MIDKSDAFDEHTSVRSRLVGLLLRREVSLVALIAVVTLIVACVDSRFLSWATCFELLVRSAPTIIVGCGVMLVVVTGEIDISVGSLMGLLAAILGIAASTDYNNWGLSLSVPIVILVGTSIGAATGLLVTYGEIPSIIVTLGTLTALRGVTTWVMGGKNIDGLPEQIQQVTKYGYFGLPLGVWVATSVICLTYVIIHHLPLGRRLFALGSNRYAARMLGLDDRSLKIFAFTYVGFLTSLATLVEVPRLPTIESGIGLGFELLVVTCVVVGGVSISGGRGQLLGVLLAVVLMTMVRPVLTFLDFGESGEKWTKAIQGGFIIAAIVSDSLLSSYGSRGSRP